MTKEEKRVLRAAERCVGKDGFAFKYARQDVNLYTIDRGRFQELEQAVANLRESRKRSAAKDET